MLSRTKLHVAGVALLLTAYGCQRSGPNPPLLREEFSVTHPGLLGSTRLTDYVAVTRAALEGRASLLAANVSRDYVQVEHVHRTLLGIPSDAAVLLQYAVEYPVGFDLQPGRFTVSGEGQGIHLTLRRPQVVAAPAVRLLSYEVLERGWLVNEEAAVIDLQQRLPALAAQRAGAVERDPAVVALAEQRLRGFLAALLSKQAGPAPSIRITYR